eukprot:gene1188-1342_t
MAVFALLPFSTISRRVYRRMRSVFIDELNRGGLPLLSEMVLETSGFEVTTVLKLIADPDNLPTAMFCTAGKDRTGLIAMLILSVLGATDDEIVKDYEMSDSVYQQLNDKKAKVVAIDQSGLDPEVFLRAKAEVMREILRSIRSNYGSVNGFLDDHDFDESWRERL